MKRSPYRAILKPLHYQAPQEGQKPLPRVGRQMEMPRRGKSDVPATPPPSADQSQVDSPAAATAANAIVSRTAVVATPIGFNKIKEESGTRPRSRAATVEPVLQKIREDHGKMIIMITAIRA